MSQIKFFNRKGQMGMPKMLNLVLGIIVLGVGAVGLFGKQIGISLPELPGIIFSGLMGLGGLFIILDGFMGTNGISTNIMPKSINKLIGLVVLGSATVLVLQYFKIVPAFGIPNMIIDGLLIFTGVILFLDGTIGASGF